MGYHVEHDVQSGTGVPDAVVAVVYEVVIRPCAAGLAAPELPLEAQGRLTRLGSG